MSSMSSTLSATVLTSHNDILHIVVDRQIDGWLLSFHLLLSTHERRLQICVLSMSMMSTHLACAAHQVSNFGSVVHG